MKLIPLLLSLPLALEAATVNVSNPPTWANASNAVYAASAGDTVLFPLNGTATWSNALVLDKPVILNGNGTVLTAGVDPFIENGFFYVSGVTETNSLLRITGFTFPLQSITGYGAAIRVYNAVGLPLLRIDHNNFNRGYSAITITHPWGVIDHNTFSNCNFAISISGGTAAQATECWANLSAGTSNSVFIEDNRFVVDASYGSTTYNEKIGTSIGGGRMVIRHNEFDFDADPTDPFHSIAFGSHGSRGYWENSGCEGERGQSLCEFYQNNIHGHHIGGWFGARGSANLVWSNTVVAAGGVAAVELREEEYLIQATNITGCNPSGIQRTNWPAEDQVHNTFFWGNTTNGTAIADNHVVIDPDITTNGIVLNRDYWMHAPEATGGKETFTGQGGASDTYPTDGITYSNYGTMIFTSEGPNAYYPYVPYTYPHPLTGEAPPSPPVDSVTRPIPPSVRNMF